MVQFLKFINDRVTIPQPCQFANGRDVNGSKLEKTGPTFSSLTRLLKRKHSSAFSNCSVSLHEKLIKMQGDYV